MSRGFFIAICRRDFKDRAGVSIFQINNYPNNTCTKSAALEVRSSQQHHPAATAPLQPINRFNHRHTYVLSSDEPKPSRLGAQRGRLPT